MGNTLAIELSFFLLTPILTLALTFTLTLTVALTLTSLRQQKVYSHLSGQQHATEAQKHATEAAVFTALLPLPNSPSGAPRAL